MIKSTKDHDIFVFREDNRERIDHSHVDKLVKSIQSCNLLDLAPILVNGKFEIVDGQHRVLAAKKLGVEIYYRVEARLTSHEILLMNTTKQWYINDFLNFYIKNGYQDYIRLQSFMKDHGITLKVALNICIGLGSKVYSDFKSGEFKFEQDSIKNEIELCKDTISYIKKMNGHSPYTESARFWKALIKLVQSDGFDQKKWRENLARLVNRITAKASYKEYCVMLMDVYNWKSRSHTVNILED